MMALAGAELETLVSEPDALTTRPPSCASETKINVNQRDSDRTFVVTSASV